MLNAELKTSKDPLPYVMKDKGFTPEQKLEIFLYASEQYHDTIPQVKSKAIKTMLQHNLEYYAEFVDIMSEFISNKHIEDSKLKRFKEIYDEINSENWKYEILCRHYPVKERKLVESIIEKIVNFGEDLKQK